MKDHREMCILDYFNEKENVRSCIVRDYDLWCPFADDKGMRKYQCQSGCPSAGEHNAEQGGER